MQKKFQNGDPIIDLNRTIGYEWGENGEWVINPEQAVVVRMIYEAYADGYSSTAIAHMLNDNGIKTVMDCIWRSDGVLRVLRNEIYAGHLLMKKTANVDFLSHKHIKHQTIRPQYFIENHHPAIIEPELLQRVQERLKKESEKRKYRNSNGREPCPFINLKLPDGSTLKRLSYQAMATGYQKVDGSCGYAFQYPVMKTVNLHQIPGTDRAYLCKLALEQSFMEMMYRIKREYDEQGEDCFFCREIRLALANTVNVEVEKQKIAAIQNEINATAETYKRANADKTKAELAGRKTAAYEELIRDISEKMKQLEAQKAELEEIVSGSSIRENYKAFLEKLKALPTTNSLGEPIVVNGLDCCGTLLVNPDGSINEQRVVGVRRKTFRITPERVTAAPELLTFDTELYRMLIKSGIIYGDEIEYLTTFGTKLKIAGNVRTLKQFLGFKRVNNDKTVDYLTATYQVNGSSLSKRNVKNKPYKGKK